MRRVFTIALAFILVFLINIYENKVIAQLSSFTVTPCTTVEEVEALVDTVFLAGVDPLSIRNISFSGDPTSVGYFENALFAGFKKPSGIIMTNGKSQDADKNNICGSAENASTNNSGINNDSDLNALCGSNSFDGCIIEFEFKPASDTVSFNYVFASEEYHDYVFQGVNDAFGFFLSGDEISGPYLDDAINIAIIPNTSTPVSINTVNFGSGGQTCTGKPSGCTNCAYFKDNSQQSDPAFNQFVYDGLTTNLVAKNATTQCEWYKIKLKIGDGGDAIYDSGVLLEAGSFDPGNIVETTTYTHPTIDTILYESCNNHDAILYFEIGSPRNDPFIAPYTISGTADSNDYMLINTGHEDTIYIAPGELYDSIIIRPFWDDITEGIEDIQIIYSPTMCPSGPFQTFDTAIVLLSDVPDFPDTNLIYSTFCEETVTVGFTDLLGGIPPYSYLWTEGGETTPTLEYNISGSDSAFLHCVITDTCGYQVSDTAFIIVPDIVTDAGPNKSLCNQPSVILDGSAPGAQTILWTSNPLDASLAGQENDLTPTVSPLETTEYILLATDNCTNSDQDTTSVNLEGAVANASPNGTICLTDSISLSCNIGNSGESYIWTSIPNDPGLPPQNTNQTIKVSPTAPFTTYYVEVTDACDYSADDEVEVTVFNLPVANAGNDDEVCLGSSYTLGASGGLHYQWASIPPDPTLVLNQQDTTAYPVITPDGQTLYKYYVEVTNENGCTTTDTMELMVNYVPDILLSADVDVICFGETATITAIGDIADDYTWSSVPNDPTMVIINPSEINVTPSTTTIYSLNATVGGINCPATPDQIITVIPQLLASFEITDNKFQTCENEAIGIFYTGNATGNANFAWNFDNDAVINSGSGAGPYSVSWTSEGIKIISLTLTENGCPSDSVEINITVYVNPLTEFSASPESGCTALEVSFTNLSSQLDNPGYIWTFDGNSSNDFELTHIFNDPGTYPISLTTTNQSICANSLTKSNFITVFEVPVADFEADPYETLLEDGIINFINNSASQDIMTYRWYFGDNDSSTLSNPEHKYNEEGVFLVQLFTTTTNGCQHDVSKEVVVHPDFAVYPPNAFTPNGDGENDKFEVKGTGVSTYLLRIYSRWGELIYESKSIEEQWDGTYKGSLVTTGTYVYSINYRSMVDKDYKIQGTVTVIR